MSWLKYRCSPWSVFVVFNAPRKQTQITEYVHMETQPICVYNDPSCRFVHWDDARSMSNDYMRYRLKSLRIIVLVSCFPLITISFFFSRKGSQLYYILANILKQTCTLCLKIVILSHFFKIAATTHILQNDV